MHKYLDTGVVYYTSTYTYKLKQSKQLNCDFKGAKR